MYTGIAEGQRQKPEYRQNSCCSMCPTASMLKPSYMWCDMRRYGFFKNKRIVLYDTLIEQCKEPEVVAVLAHELGMSSYPETRAPLRINTAVDITLQHQHASGGKPALNSVLEAPALQTF